MVPYLEDINNKGYLPINEAKFKSINKNLYFRAVHGGSMTKNLGE